MEAGQPQHEDQGWSQHSLHTAAAAYRMSDIITVLSGLREEVDVLEGEIQKVEGELRAEPDDKVLNRKFERLTEEKRNKEARRERLELQLTAPAEHLYPAQAGHALGQTLLPSQPELNIPAQPPHGFQYLPHAGMKRDRGESHQDYHQHSGVQGYAHAEAAGDSQPREPKRGQGRGGKGGQKFCKRCKERIKHGHQQVCKYCRRCYEMTKECVLREDCPHGHSNDGPTSAASAPLQQQQVEASHQEGQEQQQEQQQQQQEQMQRQHEQVHMQPVQLSLQPPRLSTGFPQHMSHMSMSLVPPQAAPEQAHIQLPLDIQAFRPHPAHIHEPQQDEAVLQQKYEEEGYGHGHQGYQGHKLDAHGIDQSRQAHHHEAGELSGVHV